MDSIGSYAESLILQDLEGINEGKKSPFSGGGGEQPPIECWPELWVVDKDQGPEAQSFIEGLLSPVATEDSAWNCGRCGEQSPATFSQCWHCATDRTERRAAC